MGRPLSNLIITVVLVFVFEHLGWLQIKGTDAPLANDTFHLFELSVVGGVMFGVGEVAEVIYSGMLFATASWGLLLFPIYNIASGWLRVAVSAHLLPDWIDYDPSNWGHMAVMSVVLGLTRWHLPRRKEKKKRRQSSNPDAEYVPEDDVQIRHF